MKKLCTLFAAICSMLLVVSCEGDYDIDSLIGRLEDVESGVSDLNDRVQRLEDLCEEMNTNISSLQALVNALQKNDSIVSITPVERDGKVVGYTITFVKSDPITIYNGEDGKDGQNGKDGQDGEDGKDGINGDGSYIPSIGIAQYDDGLYYWTLDGEWLLDENGNMVQASGTNGKDGKDGEDGKDGLNGEDGKDGQDGEDGKDGEDGAPGQDGQDGEDGKDGKDGITPQLKIEDDYWYISYDNGATWTILGKAKGEDGKDGIGGSAGADGDSIFASVTTDDSYVYFELINGSTIILPLANTEIIEFLDNSTKILCVLNWDKDGDNELSYKEAAAVTDLGLVFYNSPIITFRELQYFTGLKSIGIGSFCYAQNLVDITLPSTITSIDQQAFAGCIKLRKLIIPENVERIGMGAFSSCASLTSITIPRKVTTIEPGAFTSSGLESIVIPDNVVSFGEATNAYYIKDMDGDIYESDEAMEGRVFYDCELLESVKIGSGVKNIHPHTFAYCSKLTEVILGNNVEVISQEAFTRCYNLATIEIPSSVKTIEALAFAESGLVSIAIPDSVTNFGTIHTCSIHYDDETRYDTGFSYTGEVFESCAKLSNVTLSKNISYIGNRTFAGCTSLETLVLPEGLKKIGAGAFAESGLRSIVIPDSVVEFEQNSDSYYYSYGLFEDCAQLENVALGSGLSHLPNRTFAGCSSLRTIVIPENITTIGSIGYYEDMYEAEELFRGCTSLESAYIYSPIEYLPDAIFGGCESLTEVVLPETLKVIGGGAFLGCSTLPSITIPASVTTIYDNTFYNCYGLQTVYCKPLNLQQLGRGYYSPFSYGEHRDKMNDAKIYVPAESIYYYWKIWNQDYLEDRIIAYDFDTNTEITGIQKLNEIWYTSTDGNIVEPYQLQDSDGYWVFQGINSYYYEGLNIVSNTYSNGKGVIKFDGNLASIGTAAFAERTNLATMTLPESVISIGFQAFVGSESLTSVNIPEQITYLGGYAFANTSLGGNIHIPETLEQVGYGLFAKCPITSFSGLCATADGRALIANNNLIAYACGSDATEYTIPEGVVTIQAYSLSCSNLETIVMPNSIQLINHDSFRNSPNLTTINLSTSLTEIGDYAFISCPSLAEITIPESVTKIGYGAFGYCGLNNVYVESSYPAYVNTDDNGYWLGFYGCDNLSAIYVPADAVYTYQSANGWAEYSNLIMANGSDAASMVAPREAKSVAKPSVPQFNMNITSDLQNTTIVL